VDTGGGSKVTTRGVGTLPAEAESVRGLKIMDAVVLICA
jgi:hypothetical protein